jgi:hypothetical protein
MAKKNEHITANVKKYVKTNKTPFFALLLPALSTVMTVIIAIGLTMDAIAKGITITRSWDNPLNISLRPV